MMNAKLNVVAVSGLLLAGVANAGQRADYQVVVNSAGRTAYASMAGARNSPDSNQHLQCGIDAYTTSAQGNCSVRTSAGIQYTCHTTSPYLMDAIRSINDSSFVFFAWDANGACTYISVLQGSFYGSK